MRAEDVDLSGAVITSLAQNELPDPIDDTLVAKYKQALPESFLRKGLQRHRDFLRENQSKLEAPSTGEEVAEGAQFIRSLAKKSKTQSRRRPTSTSEAPSEPLDSGLGEDVVPTTTEEAPTGDFDDLLGDVEEGDLGLGSVDSQAEEQAQTTTGSAPLASLEPGLEEQVLGDLGEEMEAVGEVASSEAEPAEVADEPKTLDELLDTGEDEPEVELEPEPKKDWAPSFDIAPLESGLAQYWGQETFQSVPQADVGEGVDSTPPDLSQLQNLGRDLKPEAPSSPIITVPDEGDLGVDSSLDTSERRAQKALIILKGFSTLNQTIVYKAVAENKLTPNELDTLEHMLLSQEPEENVVRYVYEALRLRRDPDLVSPEVHEQTYTKPTTIEFLKHNVFSYGFAVALGLVAAVGMVFLYRYASLTIRSDSNYDKGIELLRQGNVLESERHYSKALDLRPNLKRINEFASHYVQRRRFVDARRKYADALGLRSDDFLTLFNLANMHVVKGDFLEAERRLFDLQKAHPKKVLVQESMANLYLEWGSAEQGKLAEAEVVLNDLIQQKGPKATYVLRKMQLEVLRDNYKLAKFYYQNASVQEPDFVSLKLHGLWVEYLQGKYRSMFNEASSKTTDAEQLFIVRTVAGLIRRVYEVFGDEVWNLYLSANWALATGQWEKAERFAERGLAAYQQLQGHSEVAASGFYNIIGQVAEERDDLLKALSSFEESLHLDPYQSTPHYHMGRIQLLVLGDLKKAKEHFNAAKLYWRGGNQKEYKNLLYSLGYVHYHSRHGGDGLRQGEIALNYWNELATLEPGHTLPSYVLGLAYLSLGEYKLAEAEFVATLERFKTFLDIYQEYKSAVRVDLREKVRLLTELYNNLALAQAGSASQGEEPLRNRKNALANLMNSINLKNKMGLVKGVPLLNVHLLQGGRPRSMEGFRVADAFLPKSFWD